MLPHKKHFFHLIREKCAKEQEKVFVLLTPLPFRRDKQQGMIANGFDVFTPSLSS
jgi:hypothetical protein